MKQFFLATAIFLFVIINFADAQTNLEFSQVRFFSLANDVSQNLIVSSGKIVKITSASVQNGKILLNEVPIYLHIFRAQNSSNSVPSTEQSDVSFPIWLPAGTYSIRSESYSSSGTLGFLSLIEYNLAP